MMNRSVQHGCEQHAMPDFDELMKLTEDCTTEQLREQEVTKIREIDTRQNKRGPDPTRRLVRNRLIRRWSRHLNLDESFRAPFHFTWRC